MLNEKELEDYFERNGLSGQARQAIRSIRQSPPSRRVESGAGNVACRYASRKMGLTIQAESHRNELPFLVLWDHDDISHEFYDQPPKISRRYRNRAGRVVTYMHTPDFFLLQEGFAGWVENKTEKWLREQEAKGAELYVRDADGKWRCPSGEEYAAQLGLGYQVKSSAEINWTRLRNTDFLSDYLDVGCERPDKQVVQRICLAVEGENWVTIKSLIDSGVEADALYKLIADEDLYVDLDRHLLAEPERTVVFRDREAAAVYRIYEDSKRVPIGSPLRPVVVENNAMLIWDGRPWRIINVGDRDVFLEDEQQAISSLSKDTLQQLVKAGKITGLPESTDAMAEERDRLLRAASPTDLEHAMYRYRNLFPERADKAYEQASPRAIRKWRSQYRKAEQAYGSGFLGLLPAIHCRGNRERKLDDAVIKVINEVIDTLYLAPEAPSKFSCWGEVRLRCSENGLAPPSEKAFRREIRRRPYGEVTEARHGEKAAYPESEFVWERERTAPRHGDRPFEIGHIDHTELDLQFVGARRGEKLNKAWLTVLIDAYSRMVLAWVILFEPPSHRSCMTLIKDCVKRHSRIPRYIVVDNGPEFRSEYFEQLMARLESTKKSRPPSKPRFGSIIERFFGLTNQEFVHNLIGNNKALQKPRSMSKSHDPRELAVWTLPAFYDSFQGFLDNVYSRAEHPGLGMSPQAAMAVGLLLTGIRKHKLFPYTKDFAIMCLPSTKKSTAKVVAGRGVKIGYLYYWTPEFRDPKHVGTNVAVRYDPGDKSTAFAWLKDHWVKCRSELAAEFEGRTEREIEAATKELAGRQAKSGHRRAITADLIAAHLRETRQTEGVLRERARAEDQQQALRGQDAPDDLTGARQDNDTTNPSDDMWRELNVRLFGEF